MLFSYTHPVNPILIHIPINYVMYLRHEKKATFMSSKSVNTFIWTERGEAKKSSHCPNLMCTMQIFFKLWLNWIHHYHQWLIKLTMRNNYLLDSRTLEYSKATRSKLLQLSSGFSKLLNSYMSRIGLNVEDKCPLCNTTPHDTHHLFNCPTNTTTLNLTSLWTTNPWKPPLSWVSLTLKIWMRSPLTLCMLFNLQQQTNFLLLKRKIRKLMS